MPRKGRHTKFTEYVPCPACGKPKTPRAQLCAPCHTNARLNLPQHQPKSFVCPRCKGRKHWRSTICNACREGHVRGDDRQFPLAGGEAATYGAITTLENASGEPLTIHRTGRVRDAVNEAYAYAIAIDPTYRITAISTPTSIYTDMKGRRQGSKGYGAVAILPETSLGLRDMLHPRIRALSRPAA